MGTKEEFDLAIKESLQFYGYLNPNRNDDKYYDDSYSGPIKQYFKDKGIESYEVNYNKRYKCTSICAFASSGRLCYLYFRPRNADFEVALPNDLNNSRPTKMDAVIGNVNYECKCQEIVDSSHTPLSVKYLESPLFRQLGVEKYTIKEIEVRNKGTNEITKREVLQFDVKELGIELKAPKNYSNLHFDLKQLICHLIALANNNAGKSTTLKYIFFTPNADVILRYKKVEKLYRELKKEIKAILDEKTSISKFARQHNIAIEINGSSFVQLREVNDFVYPEVFQK